MQDQRHTRYAERKAGAHNKFYEVEAVEEDGQIEWIFRWGRIGTNGQEKRGKVSTFRDARSICETQFKKKLNKGYKEATAMQVLASAVQDVTERRTEGGLAPVEIHFPLFGIPSSVPSTQERCRQFCQKYLDRLNVIRDGRRALHFGAYLKQFEALLDSYDREWIRICVTKSHGPYTKGNNVASDAYRVFRNSLRANAGISLSTTSYY